MLWCPRYYEVVFVKKALGLPPTGTTEDSITSLLERRLQKNLAGIL